MSRVADIATGAVRQFKKPGCKKIGHILWAALPKDKETDKARTQEKRSSKNKVINNEHG